MKTTSCRAIALVVIVLLSGAISAEDQPNPMNYQGKSVSRWAEEMRSEDDDARLAARNALVAIGEPSVPYLREMLREVENPKLRGRAITATQKLGVTAKDALPELIECLSADQYFIRGWGSNAIGAMGPQAEAAVPAIVESFKTWGHDSKGHGYSALAAIGPAAAPALIKLVDDGDEETQRLATGALGRIQPRVDDAVIRLEKAMADGEPKVRLDAAFAHWQMTKETKMACEVLGESLASDDRAVRHRAALNLLQMGSDARSAIDELRTMASGEQDTTIRSYAVRTLEIIENKPPQ